MKGRLPLAQAPSAASPRQALQGSEPAAACAAAAALPPQPGPPTAARPAGSQAGLGRLVVDRQLGSPRSLRLPGARLACVSRVRIYLAAESAPVTRVAGDAGRGAAPITGGAGDAGDETAFGTGGARGTGGEIAPYTGGASDAGGAPAAPAAPLQSAVAAGPCEVDVALADEAAPGACTAGGARGASAGTEEQQQVRPVPRRPDVGRLLRPWGELRPDMQPRTAWRPWAWVTHSKLQILCVRCQLPCTPAHCPLTLVSLAPLGCLGSPLSGWGAG